MEAANIWNLCVEIHKQARMSHTRWPGRNDLQKATKGQFALHSQSVQMVVHAFLANIETTRQLRQTHPQMKMKYPWRTKRFYPVKWPAQAVSIEQGRVVLPMGKGRESIVLPIELAENSGACSLVWNNGFELHVCVEQSQDENAPGDVHATVDLGEIHLAAVSTNTGQALIVTGRGIRSLKRQRMKQLGQLPGSNRDARNTLADGRSYNARRTRPHREHSGVFVIRGTKQHEPSSPSVRSTMLASSSSEIPMVCALVLAGDTTINVWPCGSTAKISII